MLGANASSNKCSRGAPHGIKHRKFLGGCLTTQNGDERRITTIRKFMLKSRVCHALMVCRNLDRLPPRNQSEWARVIEPFDDIVVAGDS
jgi:hypothetical protein